MATNELGVSFAPTNEQAADGPRRGGLEGVPQALKILSLRMPRVFGARTPAAPALLNAKGAQGMDPFLSSVMQTLIKAINPMEAAPSAAPSMPPPMSPAPAMPGLPAPSAMALPQPFGGGIPNTNAGPNPSGAGLPGTRVASIPRPPTTPDWFPPAPEPAPEPQRFPPGPEAPAPREPYVPRLTWQDDESLRGQAFGGQMTRRRREV